MHRKSSGLPFFLHTPTVCHVDATISDERVEIYLFIWNICGGISIIGRSLPIQQWLHWLFVGVACYEVHKISVLYARLEREPISTGLEAKGMGDLVVVHAVSLTEPGLQILPMS